MIFRNVIPPNYSSPETDASAGMSNALTFSPISNTSAATYSTTPPITRLPTEVPSFVKPLKSFAVMVADAFTSMPRI